MPSLASEASKEPVKLLLYGHSGVGKTGLLATLVPTYRLFIADFDNGLAILRDPKLIDPKHRDKVFFKTFTEQLRGIGATPVGPSKITTAFFDSMQVWKDGDQDMGSIYTWTNDTVFVIDSLTFLGLAVERYVKGMNSNRSTGDRLSQPEIGSVHNVILNMLQVLYSDAVKCNVIITSHTKSREINGMQKEIPAIIGHALAPMIPRFFNNAVALIKEGSGSSTRRVLHTRATVHLDLKVSRLDVPPVMDPDLLKLFKLLQA